VGLQGLTIEGLRCLERAELAPAPGVNLITGKNASGKTSLLEAIFLLGRGRSFRAARRQAVISTGSECSRVVGRLSDGRVLGMEISREGWSARAGGEPVGQLADLASLLPVQLVDPEVHRLIQEGPGERRRYLDWATFHVKPAFLGVWRDYQRALRQRNAALKNGAGSRTLEVWERALAEHGTLLDGFRAETLAALAVPVAEVARKLLGAEIELGYRPGQPVGQTLEEALLQHRQRDRRAGMTQVGPHRADVALTVNAHKARGWVSRGQQKLLAASLVLGQAVLLGPLWGGRGVLLVDDPAAELDQEHCGALLDVVTALPCQLFLTALESGGLPGLKPAREFHVERGEVTLVV
jgi:DNA replication and repair protein RecF